MTPRIELVAWASLLAAPVCFLLQGCTTVTATSAEGLRTIINGPEGVYSDLWTGTFYCGTKDGFHYFWHTRAFVPDDLYKIAESEIEISNPGRYPLPRSKWISAEGLGLRTPAAPAQSPGIACVD